MKKILIPGANGAIDRHLSQHLMNARGKLLD